MDNKIWLIVGVVLFAVTGGFVYLKTEGLRNNNPGNIRYNPANQWQGQIGQDSNGFVIFDTAENGIRAAARLLKNYQNKNGLRTITEIVSKWAPSTENDTAAYIAAVSEKTNIAMDADINLNDPATLTRIINAIISHENGINPYSASTISNGIMAA